MEFAAGGELFDRIYKFGRFSEDEVEMCVAKDISLVLHLPGYYCFFVFVFISCDAPMVSP
jgi:hypothetical protein